MSGIIPEKWDIESDVVVVGYGAAGAVSAISARDAGADVLILEKMKDGGGNSRVSGGNIIVPRSTEFVKYLETLAYGTTDTSILEMFVDHAMKHSEWIKEIGGEMTIYRPLGVAYPMPVAGASFPHVPGAQYMDKYNIKGPPEVTPAQRLWNLLSSNVDKRGIKVMLETPAKELVQNPTGEIIGVVTENKGQKLAIKARRAVIMTCGGLENDPGRKWDALPCHPTVFLGTPGNTGDGLRMVEKVGGTMWHMTGETVVLGHQEEGFEAAFFIIFLNPGFIYVNKYGKRFLAESEIETHEFWRYLSTFDTNKVEHPHIPFYAIFDEKTLKTGPIGSSTTGYVANNQYKWTVDNNEEVKKGWIVQAKSIGELAEKINVDRTGLEATIKRWNENCAKGTDPDFNRQKQNIRGLEGNKFYAIKLYPAIINSCGGPKRDIEARIVDAFDKPIPRLYASGELGSIWGFLYQGANSLGECIVFGRIAGKNAAAEQPWT